MPRYTPSPIRPRALSLARSLAVPHALREEYVSRFGKRVNRKSIDWLSYKHNRIHQSLVQIQENYNVKSRGRVRGELVFHALFGKPLCHCGQQTEWYFPFGNYKMFCSQSCAVRDPASYEKARATTRMRFGVDNASQSEKIKRKKRETTLKNYGVSNPLQSKVVLARMKKTIRKRYGVDNVSQDACIHAKKIDTMYARDKTYTDRFGVSHTLAGYEPLALSYFDSQKSITAIKSKGLPCIRYRFEGKFCVYHPDLTITTKSGRQHLIEIKSRWTLKSAFALNIAKFEAAHLAMQDKNGDFYVMVFDKDGSHQRFKNPTRLELESYLGF